MVPTGCFKGPAGSELGPWMFSTLRVSRSGDEKIASSKILGPGNSTLKNMTVDVYTH